MKIADRLIGIYAGRLLFAPFASTSAKSVICGNVSFPVFSGQDQVANPLQQMRRLIGFTVSALATS